MIRLICECGRKMAAPDQWRGKRVKCPQCGKPVLVQEQLVPEFTPAAPSAPSLAAQTVLRQEPAIAPARSEPSRVPDAHSHEPFSIERPTPSPAPAPVAEEPPTAAAEETADTVLPPQEAAPRPRAEPAQPVDDANSNSKSLGQAATQLASKPNLQHDGEEDSFEGRQARVPRVLGSLGLLVGLFAAASPWVPAVAPFGLPIAMGGLSLAVIGVAVSMSRYRLGLAVPVIALVVCALAAGLPYLLPLVGAKAPPSGSSLAHRNEPDSAQSADELKRRSILSIVKLRPAGSADDPTGELEYTVSNKSGKALAAVDGSVQLYDQNHTALGGLLLQIGEPMKPDAVVKGSNKWTVDPRILKMIANGTVTAEYRAEQVYYPDGGVERFGS